MEVDKHINYTHYWRITDAAAWEAAWPQVVADATRIVQEAGVALASYRGLPVLSVGEGITLNGAEPKTMRRSTWIKTVVTGASARRRVGLTMSWLRLFC
jgi:hypothetical protein